MQISHAHTCICISCQPTQTRSFFFLGLHQQHAEHKPRDRAKNVQAPPTRVQISSFNILCCVTLFFFFFPSATPFYLLLWRYSNPAWPRCCAPCSG